MNYFFSDSEDLDWLVLRPLSHITLNWELSWDDEINCYEEENHSFSTSLNTVIKEIEETTPPIDYHENEDLIVQHVVDRLNWPIHKIANRWVGADYNLLLEQGGFGDIDQMHLLKSAAGRVEAAKLHGQIHFDGMELGHKKALAYIITIILYMRWNGEW